MLDSIFHQSGQPSLKALRELVSILPCAVVISDVETTEILLLSERAEQMFGLSPERWHEGIHYHQDAADWQRGLSALEHSNGQSCRFATRLRDVSGNIVPVVASVRLAQVANRRVFVTTLEPALPWQPEGELLGNPALQTLVMNQ